MKSILWNFALSNNPIKSLEQKARVYPCAFCYTITPNDANHATIYAELCRTSRALDNRTPPLAQNRTTPPLAQNRTPPCREFDFMMLYDNHATIYDVLCKECWGGGLWRESASWLCYPIKSKEGQHVAIKTAFVIKSRLVIGIKRLMMYKTEQNSPEHAPPRWKANKTTETRVLPLTIRAFVKLKSTFGKPRGLVIGQGHCPKCCIFADKPPFYHFYLLIYDKRLADGRLKGYL